MMKRVLFILSLFIPVLSYAQCDDDLGYDCGERKGTYYVGRTFHIKLEEKQEGGKLPMKKFPYLFTGGKNYRILCCYPEANEGAMVISLYNESGEVASTYNISDDEHYPEIEFRCQRTGRYFLVFYMQDGRAGCGIGLVTFRSQF